MNVKRIIAITLVAIILIINSVVISSAHSLEYQNVGIHSGADGSFTAVRQLERLNKMQAYVFPSIDYNDGTTIDPFETYTSYMPVSAPQYIVYRDQGYSTTRLDSIINLYTFSGDNEHANTTTLFTPTAFNDIGNDMFEFKYQLNVSGANSPIGMREYWHGETYSIRRNNQTIDGFTIVSPSTANGQNVVYISGTLETVYRETDSSGGVVYKNHVQILNSYLLLSPGASVRINYLLDETVNESSVIVSKFVGDVMVRYGNTQTANVEYVENLSQDYASVLSFEDSNLRGFESSEDDIGNSGVSVSDYYTEFLMMTMVNIPQSPDVGNLNIVANGTYNVQDYATVSVNVPQSLEWGGLFDWLFDSIGAFMDFEIAPNWSIGTIMTIVIGLAVAIWVLKVFLGG